MGVRDCKKIIVIGNCGSGKTTFATKLAEILDLPLTHLDSEFWQPGWGTTPREQWLEKVKAMAARDEWILDGNYGSTLKERFLAARENRTLVNHHGGRLWQLTYPVVCGDLCCALSLSGVDSNDMDSSFFARLAARIRANYEGFTQSDA